MLRQLYETLVRVDCTGQIRPALAQRWVADGTGLEWTFELRPGLRFADGTPIDARAVGASWAGNGAPERPWGAIAQVEAIDSLRLRLRLTVPLPESAAGFADPLLAVAGAPGGSAWPNESGGYRLASADTGSNGLAAITLVPARSDPGGPVLRFVAVPGVDPRDLLDRQLPGADVVITRDPSTLAYARSRNDLHAVPLPWDRTYVLIAPSSVPPVPPPDPADRDALARDAVPGDARGAEAPFWWEEDPLCPARGPVLSNPAGVIAFPSGDPVARALAERVLALATSVSPPRWLRHGLPGSGLKPMLRVMAYDPPAFDSVLATGGASLYVAPFPRTATAGCRGVPRHALGFGTVPLVDTRAYLILRRGVPPFAVDGDGMVRFLPPSVP